MRIDEKLNLIGWSIIVSIIVESWKRWKHNVILERFNYQNVYYDLSTLWSVLELMDYFVQPCISSLQKKGY